MRPGLRARLALSAEIRKNHVPFGADATLSYPEGDAGLYAAAAARELGASSRVKLDEGVATSFPTPGWLNLHESPRKHRPLSHCLQGCVSAGARSASASDNGVGKDRTYVTVTCTMRCHGGPRAREVHSDYGVILLVPMRHCWTAMSNSRLERAPESHPHGGIRTRPHSRTFPRRRNGRYLEIE